ncbi:biotin/lipoyl-containing protein [Aeribacillus composti]|uniref:biotin/lipoyl-containing protein n=1 Tax=Aeribacillus composti TaxID=1868734 RepID=UPI003D20C143
MRVRYEMISPCHGIIVSVQSSKFSYIYEGESVCLIKTESDVVEITADCSGWIETLHVKPGEVVAPGRVLATLAENVSSLRSGSD